MMMDNKIEQDIIDFNMVFSSIHHCLFCTLFNVVYILYRKIQNVCNEH